MDPVTREASLDFLLDLISKKPFTVREHHKFPELMEWNRRKHYTDSDESFDALLLSASITTPSPRSRCARRPHVALAAALP